VKDKPSAYIPAEVHACFNSISGGLSRHRFEAVDYTRM
jgi:hypothetical protein